MTMILVFHCQKSVSLNRVFIGNGKIWPDQGMTQAKAEDVDDLPF